MKFQVNHCAACEQRFPGRVEIVAVAEALYTGAPPPEPPVILHTFEAFHVECFRRRFPTQEFRVQGVDFDDKLKS